MHHVSFDIELSTHDSLHSNRGITKTRSAAMRTRHQIRVCDFLSVSGSFVSVACSGAMCSCVQSSHLTAFPLGVPWVSMLGEASVPRCPGWMASGTKRQLCAVLVLRRGTRLRQSGTVELLTAMKRQHLFSNGLTGELSRSQPGQFGFDLCRQTGNFLSLRCNERRVVVHAIVYPLVHDLSIQAC